MIGQTQKPIQEILEYLQGQEKIVIVGCGGCATVFHTGGEPEVNAMAKRLTAAGKKVLAAVAVPFGEFTCYAPWIKNRLSQFTKEIKDSDAILMLSCGDGLQVVREFILEKELEIVKPIYPATNPIGHMGGGPALFREKCQQCGECELGKFAGICPLTQCAKGLLNGPCGGSSNGKCEIDRDRDCAWVKIYERLKALGILEKMKEIVGPKDWSKMTRPRQIEVEPLVLE
jgi:ferredoxin